MQGNLPIHNAPGLPTVEEAEGLTPCSARFTLLLILCAACFALMLTVFQYGIAEFNWVSFALTCLLIEWIALLSASIVCMGRSWVGGLSLGQAMGVGYVLVLGVTFLMAVVSSWVRVQWQSPMPGVSGSFIDWDQVGSWVFISAVATGIAFRYFYIVNQLQARNKVALTAKLEALQARIRPHFLFNAMNSVASLVTIDPKLAEQAVIDLCDLMRASLEDATMPVPIEDELRLCERYLAIEALRLGERLQVDWQVHAVPQAVEMPLLSLQPLLENAIYHGIQLLPEGGKITIEIAYQNGFVEVAVKNPVPKIVDQKLDQQGNRIALANIADRLKMFYGAKSLLQHGPQGSQYIVTLRYPFAIEQSALQPQINKQGEQSLC